MSFNKITIVGNLGRDPELRYTPQGTAVASMSMATTEKRKDKDGVMQEITTWFKVTLWGKLAENASKYLTKGSPVYIEGRLRIEEWTDRDGNNRYTLDVQATDMQFLSGGNGVSRREEEPEEQEDDAPAPKAKAKAAGGGSKKVQAVAPDDDIPF